MANKDKDAVIIESSALLVTLMFVILSFYGSAQSPFAAKLEPFAYLIGFLFTVAALLATLHLFEVARRVEMIEFLFFFAGLLLLAAYFLLNSPLVAYWTGG